MAPTAGVAFVALLSGLGARCARSSLRRCHSRIGRHGHLPGWVVYQHVTRQDIASGKALSTGWASESSCTFMASFMSFQVLNSLEIPRALGALEAGAWRGVLGLVTIIRGPPGLVRRRRH